MHSATNLGSLYDPAIPPDRVAFIDCQRWDDPVTYTHGRIDQLANAFARGLLRRVCKSGDAIALFAGNSAQYLIAYLGIMRAGLIAVPVNPRLAKSAIAFIVRDASIRLVIADREAGAAIPDGQPVIWLGDDTGPDSYASVLDEGPFEAVRPIADETAMILYTSGSSGQPKGVPLSHRGQLWTVSNRVGKGGHDRERLMIAAPLFHINGLGAAQFVLAAGASAVILPRFEVARFIDAIGRFRLTWMTGVPTMYALMVRETERLAATDLSSVRYVRLGSAPASQKLIDDIRAVVPQASVSIVYGTTEFRSRRLRGAPTRPRQARHRPRLAASRCRCALPRR